MSSHDNNVEINCSYAFVREKMLLLSQCAGTVAKNLEGPMNFYIQNRTRSGLGHELNPPNDLMIVNMVSAHRVTVLPHFSGRCGSVELSIWVHIRE